MSRAVAIPRGLREGDIERMQASADQAASYLKSLANPERLMLLCQLVEGEKNVGELSAATGIVQPTLSQQIGILRKEGFVTVRREGRYMYYSLSDPVAVKILDVMYRAFCGG